MKIEIKLTMDDRSKAAKESNKMPEQLRSTDFSSMTAEQYEMASKVELIDESGMEYELKNRYRMNLIDSND